MTTTKEMEGLKKMCDQLICINRWSSYAVPDRFMELAKLALNCVIALFLAMEAKLAGKEVDMTRFPKIAIHRGFEKLFYCDIRETVMDEIRSLGRIPKEAFDEFIREQIIVKETSEEFARHLEVPVGCIEGRIFRAATKLATRMELLEANEMTCIPDAECSKNLREIEESLEEFLDLPGFPRMAMECSQEQRFFSKVTTLRNRIRWQKRCSPVPCSVLGHLYETGILGYMFALDEYQNEEKATQCFWIGIFHDVPEAWTGDMPSPVKDAIPGLRLATEDYERKVLEKEVYSKLDPNLTLALRKVMMEEDEAIEYKKLMKLADYTSAILECFRQIKSGTRDQYFLDALVRDCSRAKEQVSEELKSWYESIILEATQMMS